MRYLSILYITPSTDEWIKDYVEPVNALLAEYGGLMLARTSTHEQVEGEKSEAGQRALVRWPSKEAAQSFMADPRYAPHLKARTDGSTSFHYLVKEIDEFDESSAGRTVVAKEDEKYYSILDVTPTTDAWIPDYSPVANALVVEHGGKFLARTSSHEQLEGEENPAALRIVIEWPSKDAAKGFMSDERYLPHLRARTEGSVSRHFLVKAQDDLSPKPEAAAVSSPSAAAAGLFASGGGAAAGSGSAEVEADGITPSP